MSYRERYGIAPDDAEVERAVRALAESSEAVLRTLYCAIFAFQRNQDPAVLVEFAEDALATARLYARPEHREAIAAAKNRGPSRGPGHDVDELVAELRRETPGQQLS